MFQEVFAERIAAPTPLRCSCLVFENGVGVHESELDKRDRAFSMLPPRTLSNPIVRDQRFKLMSSFPQVESG